jgi:chromate reductase, NAD(P)H dehydrogenase (quinone)
MRLLALTGSLRSHSINTEVLRASERLLPAGVTVSLFDGLGALPHFNPDLDREGMDPPPAVADLRTRIGEADALLISCPEYAHGPAGSFKNLLDWLVSAPEMYGKVACILSTSALAQFAPAALAETLRTMSVTVVTGAAIIIPVNGRRLSAEDVAMDAELAPILQRALSDLARAVAQVRS